jgi:hypothetical protein
VTPPLLRRPCVTGGVFTQHRAAVMGTGGRVQLLCAVADACYACWMCVVRSLIQRRRATVWRQTISTRSGTPSTSGGHGGA